MTGIKFLLRRLMQHNELKLVLNEHTFSQGIFTILVTPSELKFKFSKKATKI